MNHARPASALAAAFPSMEALHAAMEWLREHGYRKIEVYSPFAPEHADELLGLTRPRTPLLVLGAGLSGAALGLFVQWYTNAWDYPINVGGRPLNAWPAWVPITFELAILCGSFGAVLSFLIGSGLPRLWHPLFELDDFSRVSTDEYWLTVAASDPQLDPERTRAELESLHAVRVRVLEEHV